MVLSEKLVLLIFLDPHVAMEIFLDSFSMIHWYVWYIAVIYQRVPFA